MPKSRRPRIDPGKRPPAERVRDFEEICYELSAAAAIEEASRCIRCKNAPCIQACPLGNDIKGWLSLTAEGKLLDAAALSRSTSYTPEICGRICPQDRLCEGACVLGIKYDPVAIGAIERFINEAAFREFGGVPVLAAASPTGRRVAVVGGGPAGLACAEELTKLGHEVTVFEAWPHPGGLLFYGIPSFKLGKQVVQRRIAYLRQLGVRFLCNTRVGLFPTLDDLFALGYNAIFLSTGATAPKRPKLEGMELKGVHDALPFLIRNNVDRHYLPPGYWARDDLRAKTVVVLGGGDTAMDSVRTARRLGAEKVSCLYRRDEGNMPGSRREVQAAKDEGVEFRWLTNPVKFLGDGRGRIRAIRCVRMNLGEPDAEGRRRPEPIPDTQHDIRADYVIIAFGFEPTPIRRGDSRLKHTRWGSYEIDSNQMTSWSGVFAGGDLTRGAELLVTAQKDGRDAARAIDRYLLNLAPPI